LSSDEKYNNSNKIKKFNNKGIILTSCIVSGIIGASFLIWLLPQESIQNNITNETVIPFSNPNDTLVSVNNQFIILKDEIINQLNIFSMTKQSNLTLVKNGIDTSIQQNNQLMRTLLNGNPSGPLINDYVKLMNSLKNFSFYLDDIKNITSTFAPSTNLTKDLTELGKKWISGK
jgi:hypothetical protein